MDAVIRTAIERHQLIERGEPIVVAVSGGVDSLVLLHLLQALYPGQLYAATLDHGIRGEASAADADYVRQLAHAWQIPITVGHAAVPTLAEQHHLNLEEAARQVRYTFLQRVALAVGASKIAVGHHQDDQAETILMHLIRGSGLSGLRGMLPSSPLSPQHLLTNAPLRCDPPLSEPPNNQPVQIIRPLLDVSRAAIEAYAAAHHIQPRHDTTNDDTTYSRNRIRHEVLPLLAALNPRIGAALGRMADVLREDERWLKQAGDAALKRAIRVERADSVILDREVWQTFTQAEKRYVVRAIIQRLRPDVQDMELDQLDQSIDLTQHRERKTGLLPGRLVLRTEREGITIGPPGMDVLEMQPHDDAPALPTAYRATFAAAEAQLQESGCWIFEARPQLPADDLASIHADPLATALLVPDNAVLTMRTRQPGDRFWARGHTQPTKLGDLMTGMKVPTSAAWRDVVPLLLVNGEIAWFVAPTAQGVRGRVSARFAIPEDNRLPDGKQIIVARWYKSARDSEN